MIKKIIPYTVKVSIRAWQRRRSDNKTGVYSSFANTQDQVDSILGLKRLDIQQPITQNSYTSAKINNLEIALKQVEGLVLQPGQVFAYWHLIPKPIKGNGFQAGRNLIGNRLQLDYGGGLCQLSGIIYHLALRAGLTILERHAHSRDLYDDQSRYTPLGSDATVVYGYKDLRFQNGFNFPVQINFNLEADSLTAMISSTEELPLVNVDFDLSLSNKIKRVTTRRSINGVVETIGTDTYQFYNGESLD